jgi:hypothetical protein
MYGDKVVRLMCNLPSTPGRIKILISVRSCADPRVIMWLEGLSQLKNPVTSEGIESTIF